MKKTLFSTLLFFLFLSSIALIYLSFFGFETKSNEPFVILEYNNQNFNEPGTKNINKNLYTYNLPDPDILIRRGGRKRLSNFLLWQLAYSELYFINKLWPDFTVSDYSRIINNFKNVKRNFGKI